MKTFLFYVRFYMRLFGLVAYVKALILFFFFLGGEGDGDVGGW